MPAEPADALEVELAVPALRQPEAEIDRVARGPRVAVDAAVARHAFGGLDHGRRGDRRARRRLGLKPFDRAIRGRERITLGLEHSHGGRASQSQRSDETCKFHGA